jgi:hypothetical protein
VFTSSEIPTGPSLDDLIRPQQERRRNRQAERLGGLEVDDQLERGRLLDRQVSGLRTFQDLVDIDGGSVPRPLDTRAVGKKTPRRRPFPPGICSRRRLGAMPLGYSW